MAPRIIESTEHGIRISADFEQSDSQIWWQDIDEDPDDDTTWHGTPYQIADARHRDDEAIDLVAGYVDSLC